MNSKKISFAFWLLALVCLVTGLFFGMAGSIQYIVPGFLKDDFSFARMRPLHVFLVLQWISLAATGSMYYFIQQVRKRLLFSPLLAKLHLSIQAFIIMVAVSDFLMGRSTGREYMEFPIWIIGLMILGWIFAGINLLFTLRPTYRTAPVYVWSWSTGILFFIITLTEASLWQFEHFNGNIIRDITVQWKALGSMVGAWNQLIYGSSIFVMCRIIGNDDLARSKEAFFFYFLGMANLMFNWGHHTYVVPADPWIRITSYVISMTELLILYSMIRKWLRSLRKVPASQHLSYRILDLTDNWIILNLALALVLSVPAINMFTHGTHLTVAHAMGATIGINTTILLAGGFYLLSMETGKQFNASSMKQRLLVFNISLTVFWLSLVGSGLIKAAGTAEKLYFTEIMQTLQPWFRTFSVSGWILTGATIALTAPLFYHFFKLIFRKPPEERIMKEEHVFAKFRRPDTVNELN